MQSSVPLTRGTAAAYAPAAPRVAVRSLRSFEHEDMMRPWPIVLLSVIMLSSCRRAIDWPFNGPPPTLTSTQIDTLPATLTTADVIRRFGPGIPDPNALMVLTYNRDNGGEYLFTWYPTTDMPRQVVHPVTTERAMLHSRILAVLQIESESDKANDRMTYAYPPELKGRRFMGWQE